MDPTESIGLPRPPVSSCGVGRKDNKRPKSPAIKVNITVNPYIYCFPYQVFSPDLTRNTELHGATLKKLQPSLGAPNCGYSTHDIIAFAAHQCI